MEPVSLILAALVAGAAAGAKDSTTQAVKDAYAALSGRIRRRLRDDSVTTALERYEASPATAEDQAALRAVLAASDVEGDAELLGAARDLLDCLGIETETAARLPHVEFHGSVQGAVTGDRNQVNMSFGSPPQPD